VELAGNGTDKIEVVKAEPFDCESFNCCSGEFGQGSRLMHTLVHILGFGCYILGLRRGSFYFLGPLRTHWERLH
jgi:hypothetical protein